MVELLAIGGMCCDMDLVALESQEACRGEHWTYPFGCYFLEVLSIHRDLSARLKAGNDEGYALGRSSSLPIMKHHIRRQLVKILKAKAKSI